MSWETWMIPIAIVAAPMLLFVAAFIIGMIETYPIRQFVDVPQLNPNSYIESATAEAVQNGFRLLNAGHHSKYGAKIQANLLISPDHCILAIIGAGKLLKLSTKKTIFISRFADDRLLMTVDEAGIGELDPMTDRQILMNASPMDLWRAHYQRIEGRTDVMAFPDDADWESITELYAIRAARLVKYRQAWFTDASHQAYRLRPLASFKCTIVNGVKQVFTPKNHVRHWKSRPGS